LGLQLSPEPGTVVGTASTWRAAGFSLRGQKMKNEVKYGLRREKLGFETSGAFLDRVD
jgi:hypothetical protein